MEIKLRKFQEGGPVEQQQEPQQEQGEQGGEQGGQQGGEQDPIMQLAQMAAQAIQSKDCQSAMQVCQAFLQLIQQQSQGQAPEQQAPEGEPVYRKGGKLVGRIRK